MVFDCDFPLRYHSGMDHLRALREAADLTQKELAELVGTSQPQIKRLESGDRELTPAWAKKLAPHLGVTAMQIVFPEENGARKKLPIVGRVGASTDGSILQDTDHGPFGEIYAPIGARGTEAVVEVDGGSMGIYAPDGSLILYNDRRDPPQDDMLGQVCIVGLPDGRTLVKKLLRGSKRGLFDLESVVGQTMTDQRVEWAAVVQIVIHPQLARKMRAG